MEAVGAGILRYALTGILLYFGAFKFTEVEALAIQPLIANSPLLWWLYRISSVQGVSNLLGAAEITVAVLIAVRAFSSRLSALGSLGAIGIFATTLSFLLSTPGVWQRVPGFPLPVPNEAGAFLLKDVFLLGAAFLTAGEALRATPVLKLKTVY